jgi:molybdate transport system substrate-binding protein
VDLLSNALVVIVPAGAAAAPATAADVARVARLALADPQGVPAGVYARKWLEAEGAWDAAQPHVVPLLDVRAALTAVATQNAGAGIVYKTDAATTPKVRVAFEVPRDKGPAIVYPLALVAASKEPAARDAFRFFAEAPALEIYARRGFVVLAKR